MAGGGSAHSQPSPFRWASRPTGQASGLFHPFAESQRDSETKPRVARHELLWGIEDKRVQTPTGLWRDGSSRGRNPVGVEACDAAKPRVGAARQPWALRRNPFGIRRFSLLGFG